MAAASSRWQRMAAACFVLAALAMWAAPAACGARAGWASYPARPAEVVASWVAQGRYYAHANNSCAPGQQCGTYTQVVWRRTAEVGCAQATCTTGATLTICLYNPHGNVQGQSPY
uniref:SCP domain-containing protein n=1 Tax=Oryza barthii TaxID=65489 RepID=A0A0D3FNP3_9ORYZ